MATTPTIDPGTADALRQAIGAARGGDLPGARALAEGALARGGDVVALNAFLGMISARSGDLAAATRHLRTANRARPADATIACNLIAVLIDTGGHAEAFEIASRTMEAAGPSLPVLRYRAFLAQTLERFDEAVEGYEQVVAQAPADFESWNNLGNARSATGDFAGSVEALERAVALDPGAAPTRLNLAEALRNAERGDEAEAVLRQAAADFPADALAPHGLYVQYKREMRQDEALTALEQAVSRDPANADFQLKLAVEYGIVHRVDEAQQAFRRVIALDPTAADAYFGLAIQYEHTNREDQFAPLIERAEHNGLDAGALAFLRAFEHRRQKRFEEALAALALVPADMEPERVQHLRATVLDRLGRSDEAFAAFEETNRLRQEGPTEPLRRAAELRDDLTAEIGRFTPAWVASWSPANPAPERPDPTFLVGFPRSGTTLLDTILMGHPGTTVLEEQPPLNHVDAAIGGFAAIPDLDEAGIVAARRRYFEEVAKIETSAASTLLIDKSPLFLHKVPLIRRLFPQARFILALRHPCDVLLSCYMSNFRLNSAMSNFLRLEDAADFYDLTFRYWERARALLPLDVHTIVYERLVEDVEAETRPLFAFLGLDWREEALDHVSTARGRGLITTASYSQVTEPIYRRASGRWQRYRRHLEPVLPTLAPWIEKFGYTL
jgi:tetratricopeptide (TPR) repeat protein